MRKTSELSGFYRLDMAARRERAAELAGLSPSELGVLSSGAGLSDDQADHMVENAIGVMGLPLGLCVNMLVDGRDHVVPMAVEEPSVVAACSYASKLIRAGGGVTSEVSPPHMIGQIQVLDVSDRARAEARVLAAKDELLRLANRGHKGLCAAGGGAFDVEVRNLEPLGGTDPLGAMLVVHLLVDVRDAMGANAINTMCERLAPRVAELTGGRIGLRILSNLSDRRLVRVTGRVPLAALEGKGCETALALAKGIEEASVFAERDPYRAATHNKGIMNGVDAALIALGQDWRAIEAGAHAYAAKDGRYTALATWRVEEHDDGTFLVGRMTLPMAVGTVGGVVNVHPTVKANRKLAGIETTAQLASIVTAAGLAQNLSALRALAAEGIQSGHMRLHARNVAIQAGAEGDEIQIVADAIADRKSVSLDAAVEALSSLRLGPRPGPSSEAPAEDDESGPLSGVASREAGALGEGPRGVAPATLADEGGAPRCVAPEDRAFCEAALPGVSRTFALSIQNLPADLRDAVCVAYLLCRTVDTVEDDRSAPPSVRRALYDTFDAALAASARGDAGAAALADFERRSAAQGLGQSETERELCRGAGAVFRAFASLPEAQRRAIEPRVAEMSRGMRSYSERADREGGLRLRDLADLERYCYFVAGTVGELLTDLFALSCHVDSARLAELEARAVSFGLGLQLVNILKDVADDAARGDCFLPVLSAEQHGLDLRRVLEPSERTKGIALLRALSARAREHLTKAEEYTLLWPAGASAPAGGQVRLFCAVPLALALGTLREVELADDALVVGRAPTVSRAFVMAVFERAVRAATAETHAESDAELCALFEKARAGVAGRPQRPAGAARAAADNDRPRGITTSTRGSEMNESKEVSPPNSRPHGRALQPRRELGGKVLVTGAAGHVGANLLHRLLSEGRDVRVFLRERSNNEAVDAIERELGRKVERVYGDLRHLRDVVPAVRGCENVFHVAARVSTLSGKPRDLRDLYECNVIGTANVLRAAGETGVKRTVVTGSFSAVGFDPEDPSKPNDESVPFYPFVEHLPYGRTKMQVEHEVLKACVEGVDAVIATSCAVLGPWDYKPSRMGKTLLDFSHGKLNAYLPGGFDFVAARDIVEGHILAMERGRTGQKYIISTQFVTVDELMDIFEEVTCRPRPKLRLPPTIMAGIAHVSSFVLSNLFPDVQQRFTPGAVRILRMERKADTTKAQVELGYKPSSIRAAIHEAYAHFAKRGLAPQPPSLTAGGDEAPRAAQKKKEADREGAAA